MNSFRLWAAVCGLVIVLGLLGATLVDGSFLNALWHKWLSSIITWVTAVVMGAQIIAIVVMLIRGTYLRRKERIQTRDARVRRGVPSES